MAEYNLPYTGDQTAEYLAKARDFSGVPLDDGLYAGSKTYTAYDQYLNDNGALFKLNPSVALGYTIDIATYPLAKDDPNLIPYSNFESASTEAIEQFEQDGQDAIDNFENVTVPDAINDFIQQGNTAIQGVGWENKGEFSTLPTIENSNEVAVFEGNFWLPTETLPYTATGSSPLTPPEADKWVVAVTAELLGIARSLNCLNSQVIYSTDTTTVLDDVLYIYDAGAQVIWRSPAIFGNGETITSVVGDVLTTTGGTYKISKATPTPRSMNLKPLFIEQFLTGFGGRGQLDTEPNNSVTEQPIIGSFAKGEGSITVTTPGDFVEGGHISILHDNGRYWTYFINDIVGADLTISPLLKYDATNTTCERTWYNKAHPGKYYMRQLAQRAIYTESYKASIPSKRLMMSQFDTSPNQEIDTLTGIGSGAVSYFNASNDGGGGIGSSLRFNIGRTALVSCSTSGDGAKSFEFMNNGACDVNLRLVMSTGNTDTTVQINVYDDTGVAIPMLSETLSPFNLRLSTPTVYDFPMRLSGSSSSFYVEIIALDLPTAGNLYIDELDVFELDSSAQQLLEDNSKKTLVAFGDSWIAGDLASTAEREPITQQLAIELPLMTIINEGVGGNTATDLLARFDSDVTPHNPDFVLINTGTNDAYNPASVTFFPDSVDVFCQQITQLISKCQAIGAKPILYGVPALSESDGAFTGYELNDRARQYSQYFYKRVGRLVQSTSLGNVSYDSTVGSPTGAVISFVDTGSGTVTKWADGTMIVRRNANVDMTQSSVAINFPEAFAAGTIPDVTMTLVSLQSGTTTAAMADAFMRCTGNTQWTINFPTVGTVTDENFNFMAIGRW